MVHEFVARREQTPTVPELRSPLAIQPRNGAQVCHGYVCVAGGNTLRDLVPAYVNNLS
jgi:hypothetical protein